jgi:UrcA family protein
MLVLLLAVAAVPAGVWADPTAAITGNAKALPTTARFDSSTPEGARAAHERLRETAGQLCADAAHSLDLPPEHNVGACTDETVAAALRKLNGSTAPSESAAGRAHDSTLPAHRARKFDSNMLAMTVSLADLDLSTPKGTRLANERLRKVARRLCSRLSDELDLGHQPHFVACVDQATINAQQQLATRQLAERSAHLVNPLSKEK